MSRRLKWRQREGKGHAWGWLDTAAHTALQAGRPPHPSSHPPPIHRNTSHRSSLYRRVSAVLLSARHVSSATEAPAQQSYELFPKAVASGTQPVVDGKVRRRGIS